MKTYADLPLIQAELDRRVIDTHHLHGADLYEEKKIALLVELGEFANEMRFFKFWKKDNSPRTALECSGCEGKGYIVPMAGLRECPVCWGDGKDKRHNPALEEYVDCLHFIISIALDVRGYDETVRIFQNAEAKELSSLKEQFSQLYYTVSVGMLARIEWLVNIFLGLGRLSGFTDEEIVKAYLQKNEKNIQRQESGY